MNLDLYYVFKLITSCFRALTSGIKKSALVRNCLFKSRPQRLVLKLPTITPSGLSMGTTLNTTHFLNYLAYSVFAHMYYRNPFIIWLPHVYPGWILPETSIHFLCLSSISGSVIVSIGRSIPPKLSHKYSYFI